MSDQAAEARDVTVLLEELEPQLELLWIDVSYDIARDSSLFEKLNRKTLFDEHFHEFMSFHGVHSHRIWQGPNELDSEALAILEATVRDDHTPLPSVLYLAGDDSSDLSDHQLAVDRQRLRDVCKQRNMEVVYESAPDWTLDFGRPKEFIRRRRAEQLKKARG